MDISKTKSIAMLQSNPAPFDARALQEAHSLAKRGYRVTILVWDRCQDKTQETPRRRRYSDGVETRTLRLAIPPREPILVVPALFVFYAWCSIQLIVSSFDVLHCHDFDTLLVGFFAKFVKLKSMKLVLDMHDLPESWLWLFPLTNLMQHWVLVFTKDLVDLTIVVNERVISYLGAFGFQREKMVSVMNVPSLTEGRGHERSESGFSLVYSGDLSEERGIPLMVDAIAGLSGITLYLTGRGKLERWLCDLEERYSNIKFLGWIPNSDLNALVNKADLIPCLYAPTSLNREFSTPGKFFISLSRSIPALVSSGTYQAQYVEEFGCGIVVKWNDVQELRETVVNLATNAALYAKLADSAFQAFRSTFNWEVMETRLLGSYVRLLQPSQTNS